MTSLPGATQVNAQVPDILKSRFGHNGFLPMQEDVIRNVLGGRDSLVLMPTGSGKSLCYQLPALCLDGVTLVVSPLIALMKDQVDALKGRGVAAGFINSTMTHAEMRRVQLEAYNGRLNIMYVSPERIALPRFRDFLRALRLRLIAIDEAHCISEWGHDFRPDYRNLRALREEFPDVPVIALTATATERVRQDIVDQLRMPEATRFVASFNRPNLIYIVRPKRRSLDALVGLLRKHSDGSAIVYRFSRRNTEDLAADLLARGFRALPYHAGLEDDARRETQERFLTDDVPIVVATIAFGMGVDKPNVRLVVHYDLPKTIEGYYQETGRAGRDGVPSECALFYSYSDKANQDHFIQQIVDDEERKNAEAKLAKMVEYGVSKSCRRAFLLSYFGEEWNEGNCGACDVCLAKSERPNPAKTYDGTDIARNALSAVIQTGQRFGVSHVVNVLRGSRSKRVLRYGHDELPAYGCARGIAADDLKDVFDQLVDADLVARRSELEYPTLYVTDKGREFLKARESLTLSGRRPSIAEDGDELDASLFEKLRALRKELANERAAPAFTVFSDRTLRHMALNAPTDRNSLQGVSGVGASKLLQFGDRFIDVIREHVDGRHEASESNRSKADTHATASRSAPTVLSARDDDAPLPVSGLKPSAHLEEVRQTHPRAYERWSPEEERQLVSLSESGHPIREIASELGRQPSAIRSRLKRLEFPPTDGMADAQAGDPAPDHPDRRRDYPDHFGTYFETLDMVREGLDVEGIANRRGIPPRVVLTHLERLSDNGESFSVGHLLPQTAHYVAISDAVRAVNSPHVGRVQEELGDRYSAEEIRLVRLHLRQTT